MTRRWAGLFLLASASFGLASALDQRHTQRHTQRSPTELVLDAAKAANIWTADREADLLAPLKTFWIDSLDQLTAMTHVQWRQDLKLHPLVINQLIEGGVRPVDKTDAAEAVMLELQRGDDQRGTDADDQGEAAKTSTEFSIAKFMGKLLVGYDGEVRPYFGIKPCEVIASVTVYGVTDVNQISETVEMVIEPEIKFTDPRLFFKEEDIKPLAYITAFPTYKGRLWEPNWIFINSVETHGPVRETLIMRPKGILKISGFYTVKFFSSFNLKKFPFDHQSYMIRMQMWDQPDESVHLNFPKITVPAINIISADTSLWTTVPGNRTTSYKEIVKHSTGQFTTLVNKIHVMRGAASYIISFILPVNLIAVVSVFGYWMDPRGGIGRDEICITSYLALIVFQYVINSALPPTADTTWLQFYLTFYSFLIVWSPICFMMAATLARDSGSWYDNIIAQLKKEASGTNEESEGLVSTRGEEEDDDKALQRKKLAVRLDLTSRILIPFAMVSVNVVSLIWFWVNQDKDGH